MVANVAAVADDDDDDDEEEEEEEDSEEEEVLADVDNLGLKFGPSIFLTVR